MLDQYELRLPPDARAAVRAALPADLRKRLAGAGPLEWLPADIHVRILGAPMDVLGPESFQRFWRRLMSEAYAMPIFRSFARGAVAVFDNLPAQIFRVVPQGFSLIARGCGHFDVTLEASRREALIVWASVPASVMRDGAFTIAWAGALESILDLASTRGDVSITTSRTTSAAYTVSY